MKETLVPTGAVQAATHVALPTSPELTAWSGENFLSSSFHLPVLTEDCSPPISQARVPGVVGTWAPALCCGGNKLRGGGGPEWRANRRLGRGRSPCAYYGPSLSTHLSLEGGNSTHGHQVCLGLSSLQRAWGCQSGFRMDRKYRCRHTSVMGINTAWIGTRPSKD